MGEKIFHSMINLESFRLHNTHGPNENTCEFESFQMRRKWFRTLKIVNDKHEAFVKSSPMQPNLEEESGSLKKDTFQTSLATKMYYDNFRRKSRMSMGRIFLRPDRPYHQWELDSEEQLLLERKLTDQVSHDASFSHNADQPYPARLEIVEISARHLPKLDLYGKCDPYCRIRFCSQTKITSIQKTTYSPDWDEILVFKLPAIDQITHMKIDVFDHDFDSGPDYVGQAIFAKEEIQDLIREFQPNKKSTNMLKSFKLSSADYQPTIGADQLRATLRIFLSHLTSSSSFRLTMDLSKSGAPSPTGVDSRARSSGSAWDLLRKTGSSRKVSALVLTALNR
eukprot:756460-Hanusia_phi.AAC.1